MLGAGLQATAGAGPWLPQSRAPQSPRQSRNRAGPPYASASSARTTRAVPSGRISPTPPRPSRSQARPWRQPWPAPAVAQPSPAQPLASARGAEGRQPAARARADRASLPTCRALRSTRLRASRFIRGAARRGRGGILSPVSGLRAHSARTAHLPPPDSHKTGPARHRPTPRGSITEPCRGKT